MAAVRVIFPLLLAMLCVPLNAQDTAQKKDAGIVGTVLNPSGSGIAGATVTLTNPQTGAQLTANTNAAGEFSFSAPPAAAYDVSVQAEGCKPYKRYDLRAGEARLRLELRQSLEKDDFNGTAKELEAAVAAKPDDATAHFNLGRRYLGAGDLERAIQQFEKTLRLQPQYVPARLAVAQLAMQRGDPRTALAYAEEMRKLKPDSAIPRLLECAALSRMDNLGEARAVLDEIFKDNPDDADALIQRGMLDLRQKRYLDAELPFRRAYRVDPSNMQGLVGLVQIHFLKNEQDKGIELIAAELAKSPTSRELRRELANTELRANQYEKAMADYQGVLDAYKDTPLEQAAVYARIGEIQQRQGDSGHAIENLKKATELARDQASYFSLLAQVYDNSGNKKEAMAAYRSAFKLDPNSPLLMNNIAFLLADTGGDLDEALNLAQHARRQLPNFDAVSDTIGWIYLKKDLTDSAVRIFEELVEKFPKNAMFHFHYGAALAKKGDKVGALSQFDLALKNNPTKEEEATIKEMIKKLT
jgi:tetratricopeptide (TPR) repeat protein